MKKAVKPEIRRKTVDKTENVNVDELKVKRAETNQAGRSTKTAHESLSKPTSTKSGTKSLRQRLMIMAKEKGEIGENRKEHNDDDDGIFEDDHFADPDLIKCIKEHEEKFKLQEIAVKKNKKIKSKNLKMLKKQF